jgi:hypothetical protein
LGESIVNDDVPTSEKGRGRRVFLISVALVLTWLAAAYVILPLLTGEYYRHRPSLDDNPRITQTGDGHPGDPLNVSLIGTREQIDEIMQAANWYPAAALGLRSDLRIGVDTVLSRPDDEAPVSKLFLFGRKEDLAFEQPVGESPRKRHHVRFWNTGKTDEDGRPIWIGSASYDDRVGLSHTTGQIKHHIAPDVDTERDHLFENLQQTGQLAEQYAVNDFHKQLEGRNGGGDRWHTDGKLRVCVISASTNEPSNGP